MSIAGSTALMVQECAVRPSTANFDSNRVHRQDDIAYDKTGIVAVIPAYNEERFIGSVVLAVGQYVDTVIVIDDGSTDHTALLAKFAGARLITLAKNLGKGCAVRKGIEGALRLEGIRAVVLLDADGQHDPRQVPRVVKPVLDAGIDLVIGSRFLEVHNDIPWWRRIGQHGLTWMTNVASGTVLSDSQSGFRALSPKAARLLLQARSNGFSIESAMQFTLREHDLTATEVAINCIYKEPPKRNPVVHGLQVSHGVLRLVAQLRPLWFLSILSAMLLSAVFVMGFMWFRSTARPENSRLDIP